MKLERLPYLTEEAAHGLRESTAGWPEVASQIACGACELYRINAGQAFVVLREERDIGELVVSAFEGSGLREFADLLVKWASAKGFRAIRFHTTRPGLERMLRHHGVELAEYVYKGKLNSETV